ncbi:MAG: NUDIX pyrophosphatase [Candidatus Thermoplasmatota archaeon]
MPEVVTCLLLDKQNKLLILKRSNKVKTYKGQWGGVAGYVEEKENPQQTAIKEIKEETELEKDQVKLIKKGDPLIFTDYHKGKKYDWKVNPFVFRVQKKDKINIDWEHSEYRWIPPQQVSKFDTVPRFKELVYKVLEGE